MDTEPTVFIVDDDQGVREAVSLLMESIGLAAEAYPSAQAYLDAFDPARPGCLVLDVRMRGMSGLELQQRLATEPLYPPIIIVTGHGDVPMAVRALKHGAMDFIQKPFNAQELLDRVNAALKLDREQRQRRREIGRRHAQFACLTDREMEVVELVVVGNSSKIIAKRLGISPKTVDIHRANIMRKLDIRTVAELVQLRLGLQDS